MALPYPTITPIVDGDPVNGSVASAPHNQLHANCQDMDSRISAAQSAQTDHAALTSPHSATSAATASRLMVRDSSGRVQVAAPSAAADVTRKAELDAHAAIVTPHGAVSVATPDRLVLRDVSGRAQVAAPSAAADIARKDTVDSEAAARAAADSAHAALSNPHSAVSAATADRIILRDSAGRAQVAAPSAAADIARKDTVDGAVAIHAALKVGAHGSYIGAVSAGGGWVTEPPGWEITRSGTGIYHIFHFLTLAAGSYAVMVQPQPIPGTDELSAKAIVTRSEMVADAFTVRMVAGGPFYTAYDCPFMFTLIRSA